MALKAIERKFPPLDQEARVVIPTENAAFYLLRQPQTLRRWACFGNGPIKPIRLFGKLAWRVSDIKDYLNREGA